MKRHVCNALKNRETNFNDEVKPYRDDRSPLKRAELHCHTKMSQLDGITDVREVLERAHDWGHKAIAITDHGSIQAFPEAERFMRSLKKDDPFKVIYGMEAYISDENKNVYNAVILVKNEIGRVNLYKLISMSYLKYFDRIPIIPKELMEKYRDGLLIGSSGKNGELYMAAARVGLKEKVELIADFYDYLEIQPLGNNLSMLEDDRFPLIKAGTDLMNINIQIKDIGDRLNKPVVAAGNVHYLELEDSVCRETLLLSIDNRDKDSNNSMYFHTTEEMLNEFRYLSFEKAYEVVIGNPNMIADMIEGFKSVSPDMDIPRISKSADEIKNVCFRKAHLIYGDSLPETVAKRLDTELKIIISRGYAMYFDIARKIVSKSIEDGYPVSSRGLIGSSLAAFFAGITGINPLPAHYLCENCHYVDFPYEKGIFDKFGCDMPERKCPVCGKTLAKDGFNIPFETLFGKNGEKVPDIDLNVLDAEWETLCKYVAGISGESKVFIGGESDFLDEDDARVFAAVYIKKTDKKADKGRIIEKLTGVRNGFSTYTGKILITPCDIDIDYFTPVQYFNNDQDSGIMTTHLPGYYIKNDMKLISISPDRMQDMIKVTEKYLASKICEIGYDEKNVPFSLAQIPLNDKRVFSLFKDTSELGITPDDICGFGLGCLGNSEFNTEDYADIMRKINPKNMSELIKASGMAHGTDVWRGNVRSLLKKKKAKFSDVVGNREDIMNYLTDKGIDSELSYWMMEDVRRGKGIKPEYEADLRKAKIPKWFIRSCNTVKYLFPKAHSVTYAVTGYRLMWVKLYYPLSFYAAYFSVHYYRFSQKQICNGRKTLQTHVIEYLKMKDKLPHYVMEELEVMMVALEMYARGYGFLPADEDKAYERLFRIVGNKLMLPRDQFLE